MSPRSSFTRMPLGHHALKKALIMDLRKLKKLIDLVEESGITELEITEGEEKVRIVKSPVHASQKTRLIPQNGSASTSPEDSEPLAKTKSAAKVVKLDAKTDNVKAE